MSHAVFALPGMPIPIGMNIIDTTMLDSTREPTGEPERKLGGSDNIPQKQVTGENLMIVFTRMLEILNEKKIEKNNS